MKKLIVFALFLIMLIYSAPAFGSGWRPDTDTANWAPYPAEAPSSASPHMGFSSSTNLCKFCHAVHGAGSGSYRLLHNNSRVTECNYCHDATTGVSEMKPYGNVAGVQGEHTLGEALIPDSDINSGSQIGGVWYGNLLDRGDGGYGLNCYDCHTVHNAKSIGGENGGVSGWETKILRVDPGGNGGDVATQGLSGIAEPGKYGDGSGVVYPDDGGIGENAVKSAYCGDCHNYNPNWVRNGDVRDNKESHPTGGTQAGGTMEVYGVTKSVGSGIANCNGCHSATTYVDSGPPSESDYPHQTTGVKLLKDSMTPFNDVDGCSCHNPSAIDF